jgi:hypothetical protein
MAVRSNASVDLKALVEWNFLGKEAVPRMVASLSSMGTRPVSRLVAPSYAAIAVVLIT